MAMDDHGCLKGGLLLEIIEMPYEQLLQKQPLDIAVGISKSVRHF